MSDPAAFGRRIAEIEPDVVVTGSFNYSDRRFAANTREQAIPLLKTYNWTHDDFIRTREMLRNELPNGFSERGFMPA